MTMIRKRFNWLTVFLHIILKKNRHLGKLHIFVFTIKVNTVTFSAGD